MSLAQHLLAYAWMFRRDALRLTDTLKRVRISPLGAAALAGTTVMLTTLASSVSLTFWIFLWRSLGVL